jgi:FkbM family methyltransferase
MGTVFVDFPRLIDHLDIDPRHLIHVGAHKGEEMPFYTEAAVERITLVEPIPELAAELRSEFPYADVVQAACGSQPGKQTLSVMSRTNLSTLGKPGPLDTVASTIEVEVVTLASIQGDANIAVIDAQGLEVDVLNSGDVRMFDLVIVETCSVDDPTIAATDRSVVQVMAASGFTEVHRWNRDYQWISRWGRGPAGSKVPRGVVSDVAFVNRLGL